MKSRILSIFCCSVVLSRWRKREEERETDDPLWVTPAGSSPKTSFCSSPNLNHLSYLFLSTDLQPRPVEVQAAEEKKIFEAFPRMDTKHCEEENKKKVEELLPNNDVIPPTPVQVKSEPVEENVTQSAPPGGNEQMTGKEEERVDNHVENLTALKRDSQPWMSRVPGQNNTDMNSVEYLSSPTQSVTYPRIGQLLSPTVQPSCSTYPFPGKPYGELNNNMMSQNHYGSLDTLLIPSDAGLHGMSEGMLNHQRPRRGRPLQTFKPKKSFICTYCGKIFERSGHLERHLRIHTGEKPYGCHICGRCFNQKSSLKGHMKTHVQSKSFLFFLL